jgi:hypothetical protein
MSSTAGGGGSTSATSSGSGASGGTTSTGGAGGSGAGVTCALATPFVETFDSALDTTIWSPWGSPGPFTQNGELRIPILANVQSDQGIASNLGYDLRGCTTTWHITQLPAPTSNTWVELIVSSYTDGGVSVLFIQRGSDLGWGMNTPETGETEVSLGTDTATRPWWRMRHDGGQLHAETSSDGASWTTHHSIAAPSHFDNAALKIGVGAWAANLGVHGFATDEVRAE